MCRTVFNKTIILLGLAGYEMIITNSALRASLVIYHFISSAPYIYIYIYIYTGSFKSSFRFKVVNVLNKSIVF